MNVGSKKKNYNLFLGWVARREEIKKVKDKALKSLVSQGKS